VAPVTIVASGDGLEVSNGEAAAAEVRVAQQLVGGEWRWQVRGRGTPAESLTVAVPDWAGSAVIDLEVDPALWSELTDLGVTVFDGSGQQVAREPQNYARGRLEIELGSGRAGAPLAVELFPAWADTRAARPWDATLTVRFLLDEPVPLGQPAALRVPPGGRAPVAREAVASPLVAGGLRPLVDVIAEADGAGRAEAVRREGREP